VTDPQCISCVRYLCGKVRVALFSPIRRRVIYIKLEWWYGVNILQLSCKHKATYWWSLMKTILYSMPMVSPIMPSSKVHFSFPYLCSYNILKLLDIYSPELILKLWNFTRLVGLLGRGSADRNTCTYNTQHNTTIRSDVTICFPEWRRFKTYSPHTEQLL